MGIKFNLVFNDIKIKNLEQLKDNFYIEDILLCYKNDTLIQWLENRNLSNEAQKIQEIDSNLSEFGIIKIITEVLEIEFSKIKIIKDNKGNETLIEDNSEILEYEEKIKDLQNELVLENSKFKNELELKNSKIKSLEEKIILQEKSKEFIAPVINILLKNTKSDYNILKEKIKANYTELRTIRNIIEEIEMNYLNDFNRDSYFFEKFQDLPLVIFAVLMNKNLREIILKSDFEIYNYFAYNYKCNYTINSKPSDYYPYLDKYILKSSYKNGIVRYNGKFFIIYLSMDSNLYVNNHNYNSDMSKFFIFENFEISFKNSFVYYIKMD